MPPKPAKLQPKVVYPSGVKEITDDLGTDELVRRLKTCAQAFQNMGQDDNNSDFVPLAVHLAQDLFLDHSNKDVRLLVACCIADVFRVYAPEAPYKDPEHLKNIFLFFINQLRGLQDPKDAAFKRYFYLLENLAWVKSFNICIELEDNQDIFCQLFTLMFNIVNDEHSAKVKGFMLDMMAPLISEADSVSQELLDVILANIIEPRKSQNRNAYNLARDLLKKTASTIEPYITAFFNNALILGKTSESDVATHLYELIYELNSISSTVLLAVLPQLEFKLKSNEAKERLDVTRLLARMFSDKNSELAVQHKALWTCFLGRFNDINVLVRNRCVQYSMHFLLNHPELRSDITEQLKQRQHDPEETVRYEVVMAIITAAKRDFSSISDELLDFVKERTLDKKFKIRKEALVGLSMIFKNCMINPDIPESTRECVSWIKNKVLHVYYQTALEDRLLVERILHTCLVPYTLDPHERMKRLYQLYTTIDEHAVKAFNELLKCQNTVRNHVRGLLDLHNQEHNDETEKSMSQKINVLAKSLPEPVKAHEFLKKFNTLLISDPRTRSYLETVMKADCLCREAEDNVRELLKKLGHPVMTNVFYMTVKQLMERVAPVMIDQLTVRALLVFVQQAFDKTTGVFDELLFPIAFQRGLQLLHTLSYVFAGSFAFPDVFRKLLDFLQIHDDSAAEITLQIFINIGGEIEKDHPAIADELTNVIMAFTREGTAKQAKYAVRCLHIILVNEDNRMARFSQIIQDLKPLLTLDSPYFRTSMISLGHIAFLFSEEYQHEIKGIISKIIVKELLMQNRVATESSDDFWCLETDLSEEAKAKIEGMKLMVRWVLGFKNNLNSANSTLRLFTSVIEHDGDLFKKGNVGKAEMAWLRMTASCCLLKVVQEQVYLDILNADQFLVVSKMLNDEVPQVRERFAQKLHKGLISLKLPLNFLAIFALGARESDPDLRIQMKQYLLANMNKRRDYLKQQVLPSNKLPLFLPDYVLPYAIHLLANSPDYKKFDDVGTLSELRECLWFLMEPLVTKNESYSFSFVKKLLENIKQTKDAQHPNDEMQNRKLYAVCDLALGLVMSKTANFVLKELPVEPTALPSKLFTEIDKSVINSKIYLPREMASMFPKSLTMDMSDHGKQKTQQALSSASLMAIPSTSTAGQPGVSSTVTKRGRGRPPTISPHLRAKRLSGAAAASAIAAETATATSMIVEEDENADQPAAKRSREETIVETADYVIESGEMGDDAIQVSYPHHQNEYILAGDSAVSHILIQAVDEETHAEISGARFREIRGVSEQRVEVDMERVRVVQEEQNPSTTESARGGDEETEEDTLGVRQMEISKASEEAAATHESEHVNVDESEVHLSAVCKVQLVSETNIRSINLPEETEMAKDKDEELDKANRSTRSQMAENNPSETPARGSQRQSRKQVLTTRQEVKVSEPEEAIIVCIDELPPPPPLASSKSSTSSSSTAAKTQAAKRVLRRDSATISNGGRTARSRSCSSAGEADDQDQEEGGDEEEDEKDTSPRKSSRVHTRASEAAKSAPAASKANVKKPAPRKTR